MNEQQMQQVAKALQLYVGKAGSQSKAANKIGVAASTINAILKGNYEIISSEMWAKIASHVLESEKEDWIYVSTNLYNEVTQVLKDAQEYQSVTWVTADAGSGKTTTAKLYEQSNPNVIYVLCSEDMKKGDFLREILRAMGKKASSLTCREMLLQIIEEIRITDSPLLIFDEADKLLDSIYLYFVTMYNHLEDKAGIVFLSTEHIKKRMRNGLLYSRRGYNELHSRIGRKFYEVDRCTPSEIASICQENGITSEQAIKTIIKDVADYDNDLRRLKKSVRAYKRGKGVAA